MMMQIRDRSALYEDGVSQALVSAKHAIEVLQRDWWDSSSGMWAGAYAWQQCVIADALITYTLLAQDYAYVDVIERAVRRKPKLLDPRLSGNDDDLWSAIAALKMFYLTGDTLYWNDFVQFEYKEIKEKYWDKSRGGVWWDYKKTYKAAITNELWILLLTLMHQARPSSGYLNESQSAWKWFDDSKLINDSGLINDGLSCDGKNNGDPVYTYNQGVILGALTNLQVAEPSGGYAKRATDIANAVTKSWALTVDGILNEPVWKLVDKDKKDGPSFKGIFMGNLGYLLSSQVVQQESRPELTRFVARNLKRVEELANEHENGQIDAYWRPKSVAYGVEPLHGAAAQGSGIGMFNAGALASESPARLWSYVRVIENVGTSETPAASQFQNVLYAGWKGAGSDTALYYAVMNSNDVWSSQSKIPDGYTKVSPAMITYRERLYVAWKGRDNEGIYVASADAGLNWGRPTRVPGVGTSAGPALAVFNGKLYAAWKGAGSDNGIFFASMNPDGNWSGQQHIPGVGTSSGPSLASFGGLLHMVWRGCGSDPDGIYSAEMSAPEAWQPQQRVPNAGTSARPSIATLGDTLYTAWKGAGSDARIWFSTKTSSGAWSEQTRFVIPGLTNRGPCLAAYSDRLYDVYSGSDDKNRDSILFSCNSWNGNRGF